MRYWPNLDMGITAPLPIIFTERLLEVEQHAMASILTDLWQKSHTFTGDFLREMYS